MEELYPFPSFHPLKGKAGVISPLLIEIIHGAVGSGRKYLMGHRFGHKTQTFATLLYCLLRAPARCNISKTPHAAYMPLLNVLDLGKTLEYPAIGEFQQIVAVRRPGCVNLFCPIQEPLGVLQVLAAEFHQLPVFA